MELSTSDAERRQLTVMFCDLVGSTPLSGQLDPEDLREVVRAYQRGCTEVIERFDGHVRQFLGDGLLIYFGWPRAHEPGHRIQHLQPSPDGTLGIVFEHLALGNTPNAASRIQDRVDPDTVVISEATFRLVHGLLGDNYICASCCLRKECYQGTRLLLAQF